MGIQDPLRTRALALLCDGAGSTATIAENTFHRRAPDVALEHHSEASIERAVDVAFLPRVPLAGGAINPRNGFGLYEQRMLVRVAYLETGAGGDDPERAGEQSGAGTDAAVEDRAATDRHRIEALLGDQRNWAPIADPTVIDCVPDGQGAADDAVTWAPRRIVAIPFLLKLRASVPGSYGPTL